MMRFSVTAVCDGASDEEEHTRAKEGFVSSIARYARGRLMRFTCIKMRARLQAVPHCSHGVWRTGWILAGESGTWLLGMRGVCLFGVFLLWFPSVL